MPAFSVITKEICVVSNHLKELYLEDVGFTTILYIFR